MRLQKDHLKLGLKLGLGIAVIAYVLHSRMVDFQTLHDVLWNPWNLGIVFFFLTLTLFIAAIRWKILVRSQGLSVSFWQLVDLLMIGNFFNTFMPGAVGGDVVKAWYMAGCEPEQKTRAVFTVLFDRAIGLSVIVFYAAFTLLFYTEWLEASSQLRAVALSIWGFTSFSLVAAIAFFTSPLWRSRLLEKAAGQMRKVPKVALLVDAVLFYRHHLLSVLQAALLSAASIFSTVLMYKLLGNSLGIEASLPHYCFIVSLATVASAIPLLPGGIGVGQVAFFALFQWTGIASPENGGTLCTLVQIFTILFNCFGAVFYLRFKRRTEVRAVPA